LKPHLLDVNVLVALMWAPHECHQRAQEWFANHARFGWATCPLTEAGAVRILSNPAFSRDAATPQQALSVLTENLKRPSHQFWPDAISITEAVGLVGVQLAGHRQVTDFYLLGLALHRKARFATLDRGVAAVGATGSRVAEAITLI
jgi:hypothetical protein